MTKVEIAYHEMLHGIQGSKLTLAPSPEATGNRGGWVEYLHRSSAGRVDISIYFVS